MEIPDLFQVQKAGPKAGPEVVLKKNSSPGRGILLCVLPCPGVYYPALPWYILLHPGYTTVTTCTVLCYTGVIGAGSGQEGQPGLRGVLQPG